MRKVLKKIFILMCACICIRGVAYAQESNLCENIEKEIQDAENVESQEQDETIIPQEIETDMDVQINEENNVLDVLSGEKVGVYNLKINRVENDADIVRVKFAVWSEENGQDDLVWYEGKKGKNAEYACSISLSNHKGLGIYYVHVYEETQNGIMKCIKASFFKTPEVKILEASTSIVNLENGIFQVTTGNIDNEEYVKKIEFAVWSEENGQDDLVWYDVQADENGKYIQNIDISKHKYSLGRYFVHIYLTDITGNRHGFQAPIINLQVQRGNVEVKEEKEDGKYTISLNDVIGPGGISEILFPTWSEINGQDDIKWYFGNAEKDGSFNKGFSVFDHKGFGWYTVHAYARTNGGELVYVGGREFEVVGPKIGKTSIGQYDEKNGTFKITLTDIKNAQYIEKIRIPVWSAEGGQDDLIWYDANKKTNGDYEIKVDIEKHKYTLGVYYAHVYVTDITGETSAYIAGTQNIELKRGYFECVQGKDNQKKYTIKLEDVNIPGNSAILKCAVWSEVNGQDDLKWYNANRNEKGNHTFELSLENHKGLGKYIIHTYAEMPNGKRYFVNLTEFEVAAPKFDEITVFTDKKEQGEFQVKISGIKHDELIRKIEIPIWTENNQGDIVWYTATKNYDGDYVVNVNISNHKYNLGFYNIHTYITDITGNRYFSGASCCKLNPIYDKLTVEDREQTEKNYEITLDGLEVPAGEKSVLVAVWGNENGQNDIRWYNAEKNKNGLYVCSVPIKNHRELGEYNVHVYCTTRGEKKAFVGATRFKVEKTPISAINITNIDGTKGSFKVSLSVVGAVSGIDCVQVPIWCDDNQNDVVWYDAIKGQDGKYEVNVKVSNHKNHFGKYKIHTYVTMGNGIRTFAGGNQCEIVARNYIYNVALSNTKQEVGVMGASASRIQFPTWSEQNGQDDVVWYEGNNCGNGTWNAIIDSAKHNHGGKYFTHVYATDTNGTYAIGTTEYSLNRVQTTQGLMETRANLYNSSTPYLILVNRSTHKVGVFQGWQGNWNCIQYWDCSDGAPSTPTVEGRFTVGIRGYYFDSGASRCYWYTQFKGNYLFHSVLYNKNGTLRDGRLGMPLSHGCVRLDINNAKWIYDTIPAGTTVVVYH